MRDILSRLIMAPRYVNLAFLFAGLSVVWGLNLQLATSGGNTSSPLLYGLLFEVIGLIAITDSTRT